MPLLSRFKIFRDVSVGYNYYTGFSPVASLRSTIIMRANSLSYFVLSGAASLPEFQTAQEDAKDWLPILMISH